MPNTQIALLRGINVGRANRITMADLRTLIEELGCSDVRTLLNSGNAVFTAPARATPKAMAARIEAALVQQLGVSVRVTVLSAKELAAIVADNPLLRIANDPSRFLIAVVMDPAHISRLEKLIEQDWSPEALALGGRAAYLWCAEGILESRLGGAVNRLLRDGVTARNWATILKLQAMVNDGR